MKGIYRANATNHTFISSDVVADDYQLQANETFENPTGKLEPAKLVNGSWIDATPEEHEDYVKAQQANDNLQIQPTQSQRLLMDQQTAIIDLQKELKAQQTTTSQLQRLLMTQQATITELKKGSN